MNKDKTVKSILVNGCLSLTLIGAISTPARAATNASSDNFFTQVFGELNHQIESVRGYLDKIVADKLKPLSQSLGKDLDSCDLNDNLAKRSQNTSKVVRTRYTSCFSCEL